MVLLNAYTYGPVTITHLHSGNYDFQFTGEDESGKIFYFDELDIYEAKRY